MIRYLTLEEVLELHRLALEQSGGMEGVRDLGGLESALAQPRMTFGGQDLYPSLAEKAAAMGHSLVCNHPFVDGNKRVGHLAMETFLVLNGWELAAGVDEQEQIMLQLAAGTLKREEFAAWVRSHLQPRPAEPDAPAAGGHDAGCS
jgi:death-on-curing protein